MWQDLTAELDADVKPVILTVFALLISTCPASGQEIEHHRIAMLAGWAASSGDPDKALRFRQIAVNVYPKSWPACEALYHSLLEVGDPAAARGTIETFLESVPGHQDAMQILEETSPTKSDD